MTTVLIAVALIGLVIAGVVAAGFVMDGQHRVSRSLRLNRSPDEIWGVLRNIQGMKAWRHDIVAVERVPDIDGHEAWKETRKHGAMVYEVASLVPPRALELRIHDLRENFGGTWDITLSPAGEETIVTITENGEIYNPVLRVVSRLLDARKTMTVYLEGLAEHFGQPARFEP